MVLIKKVVERSDKKIGNIIRGCTLVCFFCRSRYGAAAAPALTRGIQMLPSSR